MLFIMLIQLMFSQNQAKEVVYYVAADGDDNWSGKLAKPNNQKTDGPFASIERARDAIRSLKEKEDRGQPHPRYRWRRN